MGFGSNRLDTFPRFLLERTRYARSRGIPNFKLTHPTGDTLVVHLGPGGSIEVLRQPRVPVPGIVGQAGMKLATTDRQLAQDVAMGITSNQAGIWRG